MTSHRAQYDYIILGAGYGGLTISNLLAKEGKKVLLLEGHTLPGGCASFYQYKGFRFDVGATTLSGMAFDGPLSKLLNDLEINLKLEKQDPGLVILKDRKKYLRYCDEKKWVENLEKNLGEKGSLNFWLKSEKLFEKSWNSLSLLPPFPPKTPKEVIQNIFVPQKLQLLELAFKGLRPLQSFLPSSLSQNSDFREIVNQLLMITTQTKLESVSYLMGILGLLYPKDTYYPFGGMVNLSLQMIKSLKKFGGTFLPNQKVNLIDYDWKEHEFKISTHKKEFSGKRVISNIPHWNLADLVSSNNLIYLKREMRELSKKFAPVWSANTAYFGVKLKRPLESLYFQVHLNEEDRISESLFFSFSHPNDKDRAPNGFQTCTVSYHIDLKNWNLKRGDDEYIKLKKNHYNKVIEVFRREFSEYGVEEIIQGELGTPATFETYTGRFQGCVGGIPHTLENNFLVYPRNRTAHPDFFRVGDTTFPGQGVVGVIFGAQSLAKILLQID